MDGDTVSHDQPPHPAALAALGQRRTRELQLAREARAIEPIRAAQLAQLDAEKEHVEALAERRAAHAAKPKMSAEERTRHLARRAGAIAGEPTSAELLHEAAERADTAVVAGAAAVEAARDDYRTATMRRMARLHLCDEARLASLWKGIARKEYHWALLNKEERALVTAELAAEKKEG